MIEYRDNSSDTDHSKHSTESDTDQMSGEEQTYYNGEGNVTHIKAVLGKANAFVDRIGNCLYDAISWIRNDSHVKG